MSHPIPGQEYEANEDGSPLEARRTRYNTKAPHSGKMRRAHVRGKVEAIKKAMSKAKA